MQTGIPMVEQRFKLNNGQDFPAIGLGTFLVDPSTFNLAPAEGGSEASQAPPSEDHLVELIVHALRSGYRLLDTAQLYQSEAVVGKAVRTCGIPRDEIIVVTKFPGWFHSDPKTALDISLANLGLDYVDVFMMHWPVSETPTNPPTPLRPDQSPTFVDAWKEMEKIVGPKCRAIGVNNFTERTLTTLLESATIIPAINQVELHLFNPNLKLVPFCQSNGIHVMAWSPLGGWITPKNPMDHQVVKDIASRHGSTPSAVLLSWAVQRGVTVIPKSSRKTRVEENLKLITMSQSELSKLNSVHESDRLRLTDHIPPLHLMVDGKDTIRGWSKAEIGWEDQEGNWLT